MPGLAGDSLHPTLGLRKEHDDDDDIVKMKWKHALSFYVQINCFNYVLCYICFFTICNKNE